MNPESICCSLETAKKLKEAGWDKETLFVWFKTHCIEKEDYELWYFNNVFSDSEENNKENEERVYSAPTSSEIELPEDIGIYITKKSFMCYMADNEDGDTIWHEIFENRVDEYEPKSFYAEIEVEAKAKMWIYLKEKGLI